MNGSACTRSPLSAAVAAPVVGLNSAAFIVTQVLFKGPLRWNLDSTGAADESAYWNALEKVRVHVFPSDLWCYPDVTMCGLTSLHGRLQRHT